LLLVLVEEELEHQGVAVLVGIVTLMLLKHQELVLLLKQI
tara:strand:+ start:53 stop:172 length:120 start_codon:yes stop_codon:yes gene_type:complete